MHLLYKRNHLNIHALLIKVRWSYLVTIVLPIITFFQQIMIRVSHVNSFFFVLPIRVADDLWMDFELCIEVEKLT